MARWSVVDVGMALLTEGLLLAVPITGRLDWTALAAVVVLGAVVGVATAALARPAAGLRGLLAVALLVLPMLGLAALSAAHGLSYLLALVLGLRGGRQRFPAVD